MNPILSNLTLSYPINLNDFTNIKHPLEIIYPFIEKPVEEITFDDIYEELSNPYYCSTVKISDDNELFLIFYDELKYEALKKDNVHIPEHAYKFHHLCKSCVYEYKTLKYVCGQYNKLIYNDDAIKLLNSELDNVVIQKCYEGTSILVYNHNDIWNISTRKCLDSNKSFWVKNTSFRSLFEEAMKDKFTFDDLDKNLCYLFVLVHYKNKNIVNHNINYRNSQNKYKNLVLLCATEKYTYIQKHVNVPNVEYPEQYYFKNIKELLNKLVEFNDRDVAKKLITWEGYILKIYEGDINNSRFHLAKLQTKIYQYIMQYKPNISNIYKVYLELYKIDKLNELLPYFYKGPNEIIKQINTSMKLLTKEILDLYYLTRKHNNKNMYNTLPKTYKKVLYDLHGIYITKKTNTYKNASDQEEIKIEPIKLHTVYVYLKSLQLDYLVNIFIERQELLKTDLAKYLNKDEIAIKAYTALLLQ
ncbi:RNA ligase [Hokovirus HKV1]|uniref:RNA ligase n=1 Tax=Hokovirus HKV1 TaxID=1977638 RepID=A0A1V0SG22_9VIRU|nr:RNA ligase [Hokovirus HKV1]